MKRVLITFLIVFLTANISFAAPNYDPNFKGHTYDNSYNTALLNRLEDEYHKKYPCKLIKKTKDIESYECNYPEGAYGREVLKPYYALMIDPVPNR